MELLSSENSTWLNIFVREELQKSLHRNDMDTLLELIDTVPENMKGVEQVGLQQDRVCGILHAFSGSLLSTVDPALERITDPDTRERVRELLARSLADAYKKVRILRYLFMP